MALRHSKSSSALIMRTSIGVDMSVVPVRACCSKRHLGPICPDQKVMCQLCFDRFEFSELYINDEGKMEDVCRPCGELDKKRYEMEKLENNL